MRNIKKKLHSLKALELHYEECVRTLPSPNLHRKLLKNERLFQKLTKKMPMDPDEPG